MTFLPIERARCVPPINAIKFLVTVDSAVYFLNWKWKVVMVCSISQSSLSSLSILTSDKLQPF